MEPERLSTIRSRSPPISAKILETVILLQGNDLAFVSVERLTMAEKEM